MLIRLDKSIGRKQRFVNTSVDKYTQCFRDTMRYFNKRINKLRNRIEDSVDDLHRRVAYDLVMNNDVILLPTFGTENMVSKENRKINTKTVRSMLGLAHYKFKRTLRWVCRKYGKIMLDVNEAYTSKTMSQCGKIKKNLGGSKTISDGFIKVDRDVNGARNIMLRALTVA